MRHAEIALVREIGKFAVQYFDVSIRLKDFDRSVSASAVDNNNPPRPDQFIKRPPNVGSFIPGDD
jgi:hypothetical protein